MKGITNKIVQEQITYQGETETLLLRPTAGMLAACVHKEAERRVTKVELEQYLQLWSCLDQFKQTLIKGGSNRDDQQ